MCAECPRGSTSHESPDDNTHLPSPSLWPIGFAIGLAVLLVGLVISVTILVLGAILTIVFGWLWIRDLVGRSAAADAEVEAVASPGQAAHSETYDRSAFLSTTTLGLGAVIGGLVTVPVLGFAVLPVVRG